MVEHRFIDAERRQQLAESIEALGAAGALVASAPEMQGQAWAYDLALRCASDLLAGGVVRAGRPKLEGALRAAQALRTPGRC